MIVSASFMKCDVDVIVDYLFCELVQNGKEKRERTTNLKQWIIQPGKRGFLRTKKIRLLLYDFLGPLKWVLCNSFCIYYREHKRMKFILQIDYLSENLKLHFTEPHIKTQCCIDRKSSCRAWTLQSREG